MMLNKPGDGKAVVSVVAAMELDCGFCGEGEVLDEVFIDQFRHEVADKERAWVQAVVYVEEKDGAGVRRGF